MVLFKADYLMQVLAHILISHIFRTDYLTHSFLLALRSSHVSIFYLFRYHVILVPISYYQSWP